MKKWENMTDDAFLELRTKQKHMENTKTMGNKIERLGKSVKKQTACQVIQLPVWSEPKCGTPNSFIRSALFSAIQSKDRVFLKEKIVYSQKGIVVVFTGEQLNQEDLTLWETLIQLFKEHPLGEECPFSAHKILKLMKLPTGGKNHRRLHTGIVRLAACVVEITHQNKTYFGSLIENGAKNEITRHYNVRLNRALIKLYGDTQWTGIDMGQRLGLVRRPLAQALHAFFSSHRAPFPIKLDTLQKITGCRNKQRSDFKRKVMAALKELVRVGFLQSYQIENDLVTVQRVNTLTARG